jgi:hypothetical protein
MGTLSVSSRLLLSLSSRVLSVFVVWCGVQVSVQAVVQSESLLPTPSDFKHNLKHNLISNTI